VGRAGCSAAWRVTVGKATVALPASRQGVRSLRLAQCALLSVHVGDRAACNGRRPIQGLPWAAARRPRRTLVFWYLSLPRPQPPGPRVHAQKGLAGRRAVGWPHVPLPSRASVASVSPPSTGHVAEGGGAMSWPVWFSFFLTSFSENLAVGRIWLWEESEYHYDYMWRKIKLFIGLRI
jgi:hypothetical protein